MEGYFQTQTNCVSPIIIPGKSKNTSVQQSLKQNFFDPSKESPPDSFLSKLDARITRYYKPESEPFKCFNKQSIE
jgi:hypothetical protein